MDSNKYVITKLGDEPESLYKISDRAGVTRYMSAKAAAKIQEITRRREVLIISQAIILARNSEHILEQHLISAENMIDERKKEQWKHKIAYITGGPLVTIFFQGFVTQLFLSSVINPLLVAGYVALGIIGFVLIVWGLFTETRY